MHQPVMVNEVVAAFSEVPPGVLVDGTCGSGGHSAAVLRHRSDLTVLGIDRDQAALRRAAQQLESEADRVELCHAASDQLSRELERRGIDRMVGFLMDLGVSSEQLDTAQRGFSYQQAGPLDMRMDETDELTAGYVVNNYGKDELTELLRRNGQERFAALIAQAIVAGRPFDDTVRLAETIKHAIPARFRRTGKHPAKRSFQAIRMDVNQELAVLERTLPQAIEKLAAGGVGVFIAYHSGEDRLVKEQLRWASTGGCECPVRLPCQCGAQPVIKLLHRGAKQPTEAEIAANPRARSAKLRSFEKLAVR